MARLPPRQYTVMAIRDVTPGMRRITLGGPAYSGFPAGAEGSYIKLHFDTGAPEPAVRTYTIRHQRHEQSELDVDFVLHGDHGLASAWAMDARIGDRIKMGGPGPGKLIDTDASWYFLAGDMTALPAISVNLERLPANARGYAVIEVLSQADQQQLEIPEGVEVHWVNRDAGEISLLSAVKSLPWYDGDVSVWAACEFETMRALRRYFKGERQVAKQRCYVSSYWKNGLREDEHKRVKRQDAEAQ